ncbi:transcriptional regulator [Bordetella genomosp. 2]|uniref:Cro/Cl family transcriptional regulator n=1 Tax=Bordetella genomosp. 2 TaxID=1983456 RepID=A0A261W0I6_9BORD|nr:YdaS family helix-turn-helix protein [Bordetella genomosp. 2]OZI79888.1 hypothetical protein CAL24_08220 [Bordetella genomosp. 2]
MTLSDYLKAERGRLAALARAIGAPISNMSDWASGRRPVPIERCPDIERATAGAVTRRDLRPDDWERIWPELAAQQEASHA